ncbi:Kelch repeat-containing protein [Heterostelium album PN500]|uniref:Kelch repeat-containing protein n=1 Tax=Heterostelium pallidum (strain ATCC 26659 / Pp 5 / PN500) TaxID=670386 RepID=D3BTW1_HETP5|nr:Kelch repeat-containing protein [Heterostelium album PN500]EFA75147.1 Kelch repeat-containing protein [Heterostelium album PN500]|eukprot:XP_020427281.1 Kelch repeat-containing protein [Heterostelium album PN500]
MSRAVSDICKLRLVSKNFLKISSEYSLWKMFILRLQTNNKPPPRVCHTAVVYNNLMYVYGGHLPDSHTFIRDVKSDLHEYNFERRKWTKKVTKGKPLPEKTEHSAVVYQDSMYIFGGYSGPQTYLDVSIYKLNLETFEGSSIEGSGNHPSGRSAHCAVVWSHYMYIFGGWDGTESNNSFFRFNFLNEMWEEVPAKGTPPPCIRSHSCVLFDNFLYIIGGYGPEGHTEFPYSYDLVNDVWIPMANNRDGPCARSRLRTVVYGNYLWCLGGWDRSSYYNDLWRFNLETRTWTKMDSNFELNGIGQYSLVTYKNQIYIYGGYNPSTSSPQPNLYTYIVGHPSLSDAEIMSLEKIYDDDSSSEDSAMDRTESMKSLDGFSCSKDGESTDLQMTSAANKICEVVQNQTNQNGSFVGIPTN